MALAPVAVSILALLGLIVCVALAQAYSYTLGAAIINLAKWLASIRFPRLLGGFHPLRFAASALEKIDHGVRRALGLGIDAFSYAWHACIHYMAYWVHKIGEEIASLAHDTAQAVEGLAVGQVKPWISKRLAAALAAVAVLKARVLALERSTVAHNSKAVTVVEKKTVVITRAVSVPDIGAIPRVLPRVGHLDREAAEALARIRDFARRFAPAALVGTVAFVLGRLGMTWARCSKVNRAGRSLCGMNDNLLDSLLADALLVVGAISIVEFAKELQTIETATVDALRGFVREI